jgi:transposase-like protein
VVRGIGKPACAIQFNADACVGVGVGVGVELRPSTYLNSIVGQNHRAVKHITVPMLGFKSFWSAQKLVAGIEIMHTVKKGQLHCSNVQPMSACSSVLQPHFLISGVKWEQPCLSGLIAIKP